jgi:hypothetical protein
MLKSSFKLMTLLLVGLLSTASMCNKDEDATPNDEAYTYLLGYWKLKSGASYAKKEDGTTITTATVNPGVVAYEFFADGTFTSYDLTGNFPPEGGTWKLEVNALHNGEFDKGTLSITTPSTQSMAGEFVVDADGSIKYSIEDISNLNDGSKPIFLLGTKKYEAYPYAENWATYEYQKE